MNTTKPCDQALKSHSCKLHRLSSLACLNYATSAKCIPLEMPSQLKFAHQLITTCALHGFPYTTEPTKPTKVKPRRAQMEQKQNNNQDSEKSI